MSNRENQFIFTRRSLFAFLLFLYVYIVFLTKCPFCYKYIFFPIVNKLRTSIWKSGGAILVAILQIDDRQVLRLYRTRASVQVRHCLSRLGMPLPAAWHHPIKQT